MDSKATRTAGVIAGIVVVLGVLVIGAQYLPQISGGASAQVINTVDLPSTINVSKEDFITIQSLLDRYTMVTDLATKNQIVKEIRTIFGELGQ
ncbi:MAG: hypothetical protein WC553_01155 [Patescibacteria group bacterium]